MRLVNMRVVQLIWFLALLAILAVMILTANGNSTVSSSIDSSFESQNAGNYEVIKNRIVDGETSSRIAIVTVVESTEHIHNYDVAISTVQCYAKIHNYAYVLAVDKDFPCHQKDRFFRRHCVVAKLLVAYDAVLFIDADMGVVFPKRKIEEFLDPTIDITFYDRFYNWEVMAGSYLVKNTEFARNLLMEFAEYENNLPNSFHGTDNGGLHMFLVEKIFPSEIAYLTACHTVYEKSKGYAELFAYEACTRMMMGLKTDFDKIRIMRRGSAWARDNWLTNNIWSPERDFFLHGWKRDQLQETPPGKIDMENERRSNWYNPLGGAIDLDKCSEGNSSWSYEPRLIGARGDIDMKLHQFEMRVVKENLKALALVHTLL